MNSSGGVGGRQLQIIYEDGKCTGKDATDAAQKLVSIDKVKYIIGGICSSEAFSVVPVVTPANVIAISPVASAVKLSGMSPFFFRNNPSDAIAGAVLADYLAKSYKTVAIISELSDYSQGIRDVFAAHANKNGLTIVDNENFDSSVTDFRSILTKIKPLNPDVLITNPRVPKTVIIIAKQARQLGINSQFAGSLFAGDPAMAAAGSFMDGFVSADLASLVGSQGQTFADKYKTKFGIAPNYPFYDGGAYDDVYILSQAISKVGDDAVKVKDYLHSMNSFTGTIGTYTFDQNGDMTGAGIVMEKISGGKVLPIQ